MMHITLLPNMTTPRSLVELFGGTQQPPEQRRLEAMVAEEKQGTAHLLYAVLLAADHKGVRTADELAA